MCRSNRTVQLLKSLGAALEAISLGGLAVVVLLRILPLALPGRVVPSPRARLCAAIRGIGMWAYLDVDDGLLELPEVAQDAVKGLDGLGGCHGYVVACGWLRRNGKRRVGMRKVRRVVSFSGVDMLPSVCLVELESFN